MNFKRKKNRFQGRTPLNCKYWHKGMAKTNYRKTRRLMALAEPVLARDWLRPEEDKAWEYLSENKNDNGS
jgi:hypothetical protein